MPKRQDLMGSLQNFGRPPPFFLHEILPLPVGIPGHFGINEINRIDGGQITTQ